MKRDRPLILAVDDEIHILHVVRMKLINAGYDVVTAEDGDEALATALEKRPDLIITDYQMPYLTGLEFCIALKEHEQTRTTPALMLTARGFALSASQLDRTNIADVISKPFSPREVLTRVEQLVGMNLTQEVDKPL